MGGGCRSTAVAGPLPTPKEDLPPPPPQHATEARWMRSSPLPLPPQVRATVESVLGGSAIQEEFAWMSWAGTVWRLTGQAGGTMFVKRAAELAGERDRLAWLAGRWPVPDRKSTRLNSSHSQISDAAFCLKKKEPAACSGGNTHPARGRNRDAIHEAGCLQASCAGSRT